MNDKSNNRETSTKRRWLWFAGLYAASLAVFTAVVYFLRWLIH